ncbi:MAG: hypothetical protein Fur0032_12590 [Terrimicrobiaceae bacterium]
MMSRQPATDASLEVRTYFVREKNALVARGLFGDFYADLLLHEADHGLNYGETGEALLRDALASLALHAASRPWAESMAWTIHFQSPLRNVFVSADNPLGLLTGTVFTDDVKDTGRNLFYSQVTAGKVEPRSSFIEFTGTEVIPSAEAFFERSEQRPTRIFRLDEEDFVMIQAQPDCDLDWLFGLDTDATRFLDSDLTLSLLEKRTFAFRCGCTDGKMMDVLAPMMSANPEGLFGDEEVLRMRCPRCGARHVITREALEAHLAGLGG